MYLNKNTIPFTRMAKAKALTINGIQYQKAIFDHPQWTEEMRNTIGLYWVTIGELPDRRYFTKEEVEDFDTETPTITYNAIAKPFAEVQWLMIADLMAKGETASKEPSVDTGLGYSVRGSRDDLDSFERGNRRGLLKIRDANGNERTVTASQFDDIIALVESNGETLFNTKWTKFDEIMGKIQLSDGSTITTVADCIAYEKEPYDYTITAEDVANDVTGTLVEGAIEPRHRNNVKDW